MLLTVHIVYAIKASFLLVLVNLKKVISPV